MWKKTVGLCLISVLMMGILAGCGCEHEWKEADCLNPRTCIKCGETEGGPLGHSWRAPNCEHPKTCDVCGVTEGEALGHDWQPATCTTARICSRCGKIDGKPLGHQPGEWEETEVDYVEAVTKYTRKCLVCGEEYDSKTESMERLHNGDVFTITPNDFIKRLDGMLANIRMKGGDVPLKAYPGDIKGSFAGAVCANNSEDDIVTTILFSKREGEVSQDEKYEPCMYGFMVSTDDDHSGNTEKITMGLILASDPTLDFEDARNLSMDLSLNAILHKETETRKNGLVYSMIKTTDGTLFGITIPE